MGSYLLGEEMNCLCERMKLAPLITPPRPVRSGIQRLPDGLRKSIELPGQALGLSVSIGVVGRMAGKLATRLEKEDSVGPTLRWIALMEAMVVVFEKERWN